MSTGLEQLLQILHAAGVKFVLIGGLAAVAHGAETVTGDVDICYARDRDNLERLSQALAPPFIRVYGECHVTFRFALIFLHYGLASTLP